ncbi:unnamed protein product [Acanthosepion pharaonis]|uniref:Helitron helicase-like domain-containing protein n=1 Tax=Acanthosepion pharaonis TaxID=158019 RepID=A0A812B2A9_ACAPH|nr:unnamed protein product [Sepia pharaonis]
MASSSADRLFTESAAARPERLASAASTMSSRRARLSVEERSLQNSQDAVPVARLRASQSPAHKTLRRLRDATAKACFRGILGLQPPLEFRNNVQETAHRCFRNACSTASARSLENPTQTTVRRVRNARSTASARALESPAHTTVCRVRNARSTARDVEIGAMDKVCPFCNAKSLAGEQLCCSGGKIKLPSFDKPPQPLRDLLLCTTLESTHFLEPIRKYNCFFQMTSFGEKAISVGGWMPTFKVQGQVYHLMRSLLVDQREPPQFLQIYFLTDYNEKVDARLGILPSDISVGPRRDILFRLQDMLHESNSYIRRLNVVIDADRRLHGEHERRFNAPACNEVAAVIHGEEHNSRDIVIRYRGECQSYREAGFRLGLLEDYSQWDAAMAEGELLRTPLRLRTLFAILLLRCELSDPLLLWLKYRKSKSEDVLFFVQRNSPGVECGIQQSAGGPRRCCFRTGRCLFTNLRFTTTAQRWF